MRENSTVSSVPGAEITPPPSSLATRLRNFLIVLVAVVLSVAVVVGSQTPNQSTTLTHLAENATPLEVALTNGKPTLIEFYANWCTSCQSMAGDMSELETQYHDQVNFVMLNVDNTKWLPEILHYRVDGIPHFVYLEKSGEAVASAIGEQPQTVMAANLDALVAATPLPYAQATGQTSRFSAPVAPKGGADPRSHGSQVVGS